LSVRDVEPLVVMNLGSVICSFLSFCLLLFNPLRTMRKGNVRARPPDAPQAHQGNRKGSTGKPLREYRRIPEGVQENPLPHTGEFPCFRSCRFTAAHGTVGWPLDEVRADACDCAACKEAADRTCNERPDGLQSRLEHSRPVDFKFHVVFPFLLFGVGCGCDVLRALLSACGCDAWDI